MQLNTIEMQGWPDFLFRIHTDRVNSLVYANALTREGSETFFFPVIVFFYALAPGSLLSYAGRGWADEDARLRQWPRGRMRRWRASSAWASLCHLLWSGHWLLLPQHSGWSLPVLTSAVAFVGGGDLFECTPTPLSYQVWSTLVVDSRNCFFFFRSQMCTILVCSKQSRDQNMRSVWWADVMLQLFAEVIIVLLMELLHKKNQKTSVLCIRKLNFYGSLPPLTCLVPLHIGQQQLCIFIYFILLWKGD